MAEPTAPVLLRSKPGIKRDGTAFEGDNYVDGQWVRFQRGLPRKIAGYKQITKYATGLIRQFYTRARDGFVYTHIGHSDGVARFTIDINGDASSLINRTPVGYTPGQWAWNFDAMYDAGGGIPAFFANYTDTLTDISNVTPKPIYFGDYYSTAPLIPLVEMTSSLPLTTSGNIVVLHPYLFILDSSGYVRWSDINDPENFSSGDAGDAYIAAGKLVKGLPLRGGGQAPAGLIWSLTELIRVTYVGGDDVFRFDTVTASTSILAVNSVIEYDGIYYWMGMDRFLSYSGVVKEVPNDLNINWFYDNVNYNYANKIFAFKVPRFGEIWWCYPRGEATECTHAIIYNVRENTWYDTVLPNGGRTAGIYAQVFRSPLLSGLDPSDTGYKVWRHEYGVDEIDGPSVNAVQSYFETADLAMMMGEKPENRWLYCNLMEQDFVQVGNMTVQVKGRVNARAPDIAGPVKTFSDSASSNAEELVFLNEQRRELRFRFESNTQGGSYQMGEILIHVGPQDGRVMS